jgi:prophage tail gpP-like protein
MSKLTEYIQKNGKAPLVSLHIKPLGKGRKQFVLTQFLNYNFTASVLIPVDAFSFTFAMPQTPGPINSYIQEGDIAELYAGEKIICTGIVDVVDIETTLEGGDVVTIMGRNLLGQLEDQSTVNAQDKPMWGNNVPLATAAGSVIQHTRIRGLVTQQAPAGSFLFATEPGESKLTALSRFVEPLNCIIFGDSVGNLVVGRPNMGQAASGDVTCDRDRRTSNVLSIKAIRASTQIPNVVIPIWTGQETVQHRISASQGVLNPAEGPIRLYNAEHYVQKCVVVCGSNLLQAYALREIARANISELTVQANVKSHFNDNLAPFSIDTVYNVNYTRAGIQEKMYLYQVEYSCDAQRGPRTSLYFCRLGRIVAGVSVASVTRKIIASGKLPKL